ncbi:multidrug resistance-associated protein 5 [Tanacetum coccineum]
MIPGTDLHQFDVYNDGYFAYLPLTYVDGVILKIVVPRMHYEQLAEFLEEKCGCYFQGLYYQVPSQDLEMGLVRVGDDRSTSYMFDVEETFGRFTLYLDHLDMNLSEYLSQDITYDMDVLVSKKIGPPKKRTSTTDGVEARNSTTQGVKARTITKDNGKEKLRSYEKSDLDSYPGSTIKLGVTVNHDGKTYFDRFYVCFAGLTDGWKAVVNVKNKDNWTCFLKLLEEDVGCSKGNGLTLMSDQHKVLLKLLKMLASSLIPLAFNTISGDKIKSANPNAHKYLMDKNPKTWSRAFFEVDRGCEAIKNGFSECFNSVIVNVRHKPLLTILEAIRVIVLERMNKMREISRKWNPGVCANIKKRLEWLKEQQRFWHVKYCVREDIYEVRSRSEGFTVDEGKRTCSCRMWQLSGLPCVHATKVTFLINRVPESYVPTWFETDMYFVAYHNYVKPVHGMNFWPNQSMYSTVLPPKPRKMLGRPRKKRIRAIGKGGSSTRVSKVDSHGSCSNCKKPGHNKSSCKEPLVEQTPKPKGVVGSRGRGCVAGSRCGASGSIDREAGGSGVAGGLIGRGAGGSGGASGSRGRGKKKVGTSSFAKWFGLQDEPEQTQAEPQ